MRELSWSFVYPRAALGTVLLSTLVHYLNARAEDLANQRNSRFIGASAYQRSAVFAYALVNLAGALPHWLMRPYGGLVAIARIDPGKPSVATRMMASLQAQEGLHRVVESVALLYVCFKERRLCFKALLLALSYQLAEIWTLKVWKRKDTTRQSDISRAPGRFRRVPFLLITALPVLVSVIRGDTM